MRERVLAVIGAVCLIAVALLVRSTFTGDDGGSGGGGSGNGDLPVVACTPDLAAVCDALVADDRIAADPPTLDLADAAAPPAELDAWITWDPAPAIANIDADRANQPEPWDDPVVLAGGVLGVLGTADALTTTCPGQTSWVCLGEAGIDGTSALGVGDPTTSEGLVRLGPLAQATAEDPLDGFSLDPSLSAVVQGPPDGQDTAPTMARWQVTQPGKADLVVGPLALLKAQAATDRGQDRDLVAETGLNDQPVAIVVAWRTDAGEDLAGLCEGEGIDEGSATGEALVAVGTEDLCPADVEPMDDQLAGFLYQVRERVS